MRQFFVLFAFVVTAGVAALGASSALARNTLTVCSTGPPACNYASIAGALGAASDGDRIMVAPGTYIGGFTITKSVGLIGSGAPQTTISGGDPAALTVSAGVVVDIRGVTITAAVETGIVNDGTLALRDSAVTRNLAVPLHEQEAAGVLNNGVLTLLRSTVSDNGGAGNVLVGGLANHGTAVVRESTFSRNIGLGFGGLRNAGSATITGTSFDLNRAAFTNANLENEGGLVLRTSTVTGGICQYACGILNRGSDATALVVDTIVSGNISQNHAGAVTNEGGTLTIRRTGIEGNAGQFGAPGGISNLSGLVTIESSTVSENSSRGPGGGIYNQGTMLVRTSTVRDNMAQTVGGGIANYGSVEIRNSVVTGNTALHGQDGLFGGGIFNAGIATLRHSGVVANVPDDCAGC